MPLIRSFARTVSRVKERCSCEKGTGLLRRLSMVDTIEDLIPTQTRWMEDAVACQGGWTADGITKL